MATVSSPEELFRLAAQNVFNTWTALQLAVEHGMGGAQGLSKAMSIIDAVVDLFKLKPNVEWEEVADLLGDMMDDEFNTVCEDDSTDEVGLLLWEFYRHCVSGDKEVVEAEIAKLPKGANWLSKCINQTPASASQDDEEDDDEEEDEGASPSNGQHAAAMAARGPDADGWTQVQRRRN